MLIVAKPSSFDGIGNAFASITMALSSAISSVVQVHRTQQGYYKDERYREQRMDPGNLTFAICMTSMAISFASVSLLSGGFRTYFIVSNPSRPLVLPRQVPTFHIISILVFAFGCAGIDIYAAAQLIQFFGKDRFYPWIIASIVMQIILVVYFFWAALKFRQARRRDIIKQREILGRNRWKTFSVAFVIFWIIMSFMIWAHASPTGDVGVNFGDWSYGQTFNAAAGITGFFTTLAGWLTAEDSLDF